MKENPLMKTILFYFCHPNAKVAQLVEHDLAKVGVASSNLVFRSKAAHSGFFYAFILGLSLNSVQISRILKSHPPKNESHKFLR